MYKNWITGNKITPEEYNKKNWFIRLFYYYIKLLIAKPTGSTPLIAGQSSGIESMDHEIYIRPIRRPRTSNYEARREESRLYMSPAKDAPKKEEPNKKVEYTPYYGSSVDNSPISPISLTSYSSDDSNSSTSTDSFSGFVGGESGGGGATGNWSNDDSSSSSSSYDSSSYDSGSSYDSSSSYSSSYSSND